MNNIELMNLINSCLKDILGDKAELNISSGEEKLFEEDVLIATNQVVMQKDTNITLTKSDIEKQKEEYVERIVNEFDNIIKMYIENNSLVMVYDKKELNNIFFDNNYVTELKIRYFRNKE